MVMIITKTIFGLKKDNYNVFKNNSQIKRKLKYITKVRSRN